MGFLKDQGTVLLYDEAKKYHQYIKEHGILQFLNLYKKYGSGQNDGTFYWGDELEYQIVNLDNTQPRIDLNTDDIFANLESDLISIQYEYGRWMVEAIPKNPYKTICNPHPVLDNLRARRETISQLLKSGEILYSAPVFPMLGVGDYFVKSQSPPQSPEKNIHIIENHNGIMIEEEKVNPNEVIKPIEPDYAQNPYSKSQFLHDEIINQHPRFAGLTRNIRLRRGEKVCIKTPIYQDVNTSLNPTTEEPYPGNIYMDAMGFGMGNCSLQVTFSTKNIDSARFLTDQLAVFAPLFLALSAGSPIFKGKLADVDVRWDVISDSVDDRTIEERDEKNSLYLPKSRYSSISYYISNDPMCKPEYNDLKFRVNEEIIDYAKQKGKEMGLPLDDQLLNHIGWLFVRDPLVIFEDKIYVDDETTTSHFENFQSTNWNSVRFKPPPSLDSEIGWRVELRPTEIQLTDEENSSFIIFALFLTRYIELFHPNFYMPISKMDENFRRAHTRGAATNKTFWFRKNIPDDTKDEYVEITLEEFFTGKKDNFTGIFALMEKLCDRACCKYDCPEQKEAIESYKKLNNTMIHSLYERATGKRQTLASWIRSFVMAHPNYKQDSIVSHEIASDLVRAMDDITNERKKYTDFVL